MYQYHICKFVSLNLSTDLLLWGYYIKKCISPVRICRGTRNARNASTKFRKTSESENSPKMPRHLGAGEISRNLRLSFYCLSLAVLIEDIRILLISKQSFNNDAPISSVMYSDIVSNFIQYSVSAVSFNAMCILEIKSALL